MRQDPHQTCVFQQTLRLKSLIVGADFIGQAFINVLQEDCLILELPSGLNVSLIWPLVWERRNTLLGPIRRAP